MSDEIRNEDGPRKRKKKPWDNNGDEWSSSTYKPEVQALPNLSHLPQEEKDKILRKVINDAAATLMATYMSLGVGGVAKVIASDQRSTSRFLMSFRNLEEDETEEDIIRKSLE